MNDAPHEVWFYTRDGERCGPVTFTDLRARAKEATLNPRLDLVWTNGMDEWKPACEIDGLFKRNAGAKAQDGPAPAANPYAPPQQESAAELMRKEGNWPGARRRSYLFATFIFPGLWGFGFAVATGLLSPRLGPEIMKFAKAGVNIVPALVSIYFSLKRLVNLGMSRWWFLGNFVPFLNFWVGYRCFACPGGYAYHKKLDGAGVFLAIIYWLMLVIVLLAVVALIALLYGAIGTPEIQQQIRDALRAAAHPASKP